MNKEQETFVEELKNNVAFQLSLSSKELFHSNFLAWLAEDVATREVFNELLHTCFGVDWDFNPKTMMVKREYKNFDLCICYKLENKNEEKPENEEDEEYDLKEKYIPGPIIFVLENKFKSIPYVEQLKKYQDKVREYNENMTKKKVYKEQIKSMRQDLIEKPKYILLSLTDMFRGDNMWTLVTYPKYIAHLSDSIKKFGKLPVTYQGFIKSYCEFIDRFSSYINKCLEEEICRKDTIVDGANWDSLTKHHHEFNAIRCYDIWQKLIMQHCAYILIQKLKGKKNIIMVHSDKEIEEFVKKQGRKEAYFCIVNFFHGEALLELKYYISDKGIITIQQQGNKPLRIGILALKGKKITNNIKNENIKKWKEHVVNHIDSCGLKEYPIFKNEIDKSENSFNSFGSFYYFNLSSKELSIQETLDLMIKEMDNIVDYIKKNKNK